MNNKKANKKNKLNIVMLSNITISPQWDICLNELAINNSRFFYNMFYIDITDFANKNSYKVLKNADYIIVYIDFNVKYPNAINDIYGNKYTCIELYEFITADCKRIIDYLKSSSHATIIWFGFEDLCYKHYWVNGFKPIMSNLIDKINDFIFSIMNDLIFIDFKRIISKIGVDKAYDYRNLCEWNMPYSLETVKMMVSSFVKQIKIEYKETPKCLVLDCDNVLWDGILSEDGEGGISIDDTNRGIYHKNFQIFLLSLYYQGVILTICSKNDEKDVLHILNHHTGMIIREKHLACIEANWNNKVYSIENIASKLGIGLDSLVFVDDSQYEVELVNKYLPQVKTILFDKKDIFEKLECFNLNNEIDLKEVFCRNNTYQTNSLREEIKRNCKTTNEFLSELELQIDIHPSIESELSRIVNLVQRTNKYTNGRRFNEEQMRVKFQSPEYNLYSVNVKDKFSDLGLVGVIGITDERLDLFCLSCRALGRNIEYTMLNFIKDKGVKNYFSIETSKNKEIIRELHKTFDL